ncbi:hypothetical protein AA958_10005 [Streptomyces sp. CNQ-509]|nr:hypothetical protein AA958_10005 [Streptomyces sp. CNQ-509]
MIMVSVRLEQAETGLLRVAVPRVSPGIRSSALPTAATEQTIKRPEALTGPRTVSCSRRQIPEPFDPFQVVVRTGRRGGVHPIRDRAVRLRVVDRRDRLQDEAVLDEEVFPQRASRAPVSSVGLMDCWTEPRPRR